MQALLKELQQGNRIAMDGLFGQCGEGLVALAETCAAAFNNGNKLLFCGNGGSACDALHIAGEFVGRFVNDRKALPAIALTADTGIITAVANDYGYDEVFARQVAALGYKGDVLVALSTSGKSPSVLRALEVAKQQGLITALFTGEKGRDVKNNVDFPIVVPSAVTAHIQEAHHAGLHALASLVEAKLFA